MARARKGAPEVNEAPPAAAPQAPQPQTDSKPKRAMSASQKAAAVIVSMGADKASELYQFMESEDIERLTLEVAQLGFLDSSETEDVLSEYYQMCMTNKAVTEGGLEYARTVLEKAFGAQMADGLLDKVAKSLKRREFSFLNRVDSKSLFTVLQSERPQTIALVLSYVEPEKAATVIQRLEPERQIMVVESMASMDDASPSAVKIVEAEMEKRFSSIIVSDNVKVGGIDFVANMMNNIDRTSEKSIFDGLSVNNKALAEDIRKRMFVFEDIVNMDDRSVQRFVRDCDPKDLVLALKATTQEVSQKFFANMSSRMAQNIQEDLEITANVRMKDAEEAQQRIVSLIRTLEEEGEILIVKAGKDDIIA